MKTTLKSLCLSAALMLAYTGVMSQAIPTIEMPLDQTIFANSNQGVGVSSNPVIVKFSNDAINSNVFSTYGASCTISFKNQQFIGLNYGTANYAGSGNSSLQTTGLVFGAAPTLASDPTPQGALPVNKYDVFGAYSADGGPSNEMYTSNPKATGGQLGTGIIVGNDALENTSGGVEVFTTAQALFGNASYPVGSRVYFGDIVITFSEPVKNPVIHLAGLGGSYRYTPFGVDANIAANYLKTYFSTELELVNTGVTSTLMSKNPLMVLSAPGVNNGNNILNANNANPNGGSIDVGIPSGQLFNDYGAASGSVRINGNVQTITYKVYLKSGTASQFAWSTKGLDANGAQLITNALRDPFTGDVWRIAASYDKPVQQVSGNVFYDINGYAGNVNTAGLNPAISTYEKVNINNTMNANLIDALGNVVATTPIGSDGTYLFDAVATGNYTVQLTQLAGVVGQPKPATTIPTDWVNTGERNFLQAGTDGTTDGNSSQFTVGIGDILTNVNFGVLLKSQLPLPVSLTSFNGSLSAGIAKLNWVVTNEVSLKNYGLERSIDGVNYTNVTNVTPRNTNLLETYGYNDNVANLSANKIYYRLKINENSGSFRYSNVIIVKKSSLKIASVYPNPFVESIKVELESATKDNAQIRIIDALGKVIITQQEKVEIGGNQIIINGLGKIAQGAYMIEITTSTEKILQKLSK
jgi:hypothetical protein